MCSPTGPLEATFDATTANLARIRAYVREACSKAGIAPAPLDDIEVAADEACANIIEHGYAGMVGGTIRVRLERLPDTFRVTLIDRCEPFNSSAYQLPDLAQVMGLLPGGRGIYLMRSLMDEVTYRPQQGGCNELTMVKRLG